MRRALVVAAALWLAGCGAVRTRPASLADARAASETPSSKEASALAPQSFAEAERLRKEAEQADAKGDTASAQFLGEEAVAAYARAFVHARTVRATQQLEAARAEQAKAEEELGRLQGEQSRAATDVAALQLRAKALRDAPAPGAVERADPARERARRDAARALLADASMLCAAARLVGASDDALKAPLEAARAVEGDLDKSPVPVDRALSSRAACLAALVQARRAAGPATDAGQTLLEELGREGSVSPARDDRGVVVSIGGAFDGGDVSKRARPALELLAKVAKAHPSMPVLVVLHDAARVDDRTAERREAAVRSALGAPKLDVVRAGQARPVADPRRDKAANDRVEIVFVEGKPPT
ncbi:MAG: hypothetical protein IT374_07120 [Polyangiaceae bacterium]|nr:hypothetical protein [Polyangiaceae bacterium]